MLTKVCYISVLKLNRLLIICDEIALQRLPVFRVLKCFVTPTLTYTAQADESVLHICIETQQVIHNMCCTCFVSTASETRILSNALIRRL